jgi:hypothetical protein
LSITFSQYGEFLVPPSENLTLTSGRNIIVSLGAFDGRQVEDFGYLGKGVHIFVVNKRISGLKSENLNQTGGKAPEYDKKYETWN